MHMCRPVRTFLALLVAYAIVLGGIVGPVLGHGFDPSRQLCSQGAEGAPGIDPVSGDPRAQNGHDCCPALCGSASILPPVADAERAAFQTAVVHPLVAVEIAKSQGLHNRSARAPPLG